MSKKDSTLESKSTESSYTVTTGNIDNSPIDSKIAGSVLESMLTDKIILNEESFTRKENKDTGNNTGYIATDKNGQKFMLKEFNAKQVTLEEAQNQEYSTLFKKFKTTQDKLSADSLVWDNFVKYLNRNREEAVAELIGSELYKTLLYDRSPSIALVETSKEGKLYIRSKYLEDVTSLSNFSGSTLKMRIEADSEKLKKLTGFEKVIAACNILGEVDYQPENVMVKEPETDNPVAVKIDHGKSFITFPKDWHTLIKVTNSQFIRYSGYSRAIDRGNLRFNIREYSDSLNQMLKQLNDDKIDALVSQKIAELRKIKFDPKGMTVYVDNGIKDIIKEIKDFDDLERHYKAELKNHISNMKDIAKKMEIVALFSVNNKFQTGGLLNTMADSP